MVRIRTGLGVSLLVVAVLSCEDPLCACSDPNHQTFRLSADSLFFSALGESQTIQFVVEDSLNPDQAVVNQWTSLDSTIATVASAGGGTATVTSVAPGVTHVAALVNLGEARAVVVVDTLP